MTDPRLSIIPAGAVLDNKLEPRDLQVLCLFGRHIDRKGWCRRSQVQMAKEIGCARSTVQASIDRLIDAGWLQKRAENDPHTKGIRASAFEYRVVLDVPDQPQDVVGAPADRSAPPADETETGAVEAPETGRRHPPAPPADVGNAGVSGVRNAISSAPMLTTTFNEKKEARMRLGGGLPLDLVDGRVRLHSDDPLFRQIASMQRKHPPTDRNGYWTFDLDLVQRAQTQLAKPVPDEAERLAIRELARDLAAPNTTDTKE